MTDPAPQRLVAVDVGGTFTDLVMYDGPHNRLVMAKVPSTPPNFYSGVVDAMTKVQPDLSAIHMFLHGTTMHLNAYLERKGARTALLTTSGFGDVYEMRRGNRVLMYDLHFQYPAPLVPRDLVYEVAERMSASGNSHPFARFGESFGAHHRPTQGAERASGRNLLPAQLP